MNVTLAYPYTDPATGKVHDPDETVDLPLIVAKNLIADGLARVPAGESDEPSSTPVGETLEVTLAYPHNEHPADATVALPAPIAAALLSDGLARLPGEPPAEQTEDEPTSVKDILAAVGDDKAKAQEYLDAENATEKPRTSLVEGLQAVLDADDQGNS